MKEIVITANFAYAAQKTWVSKLAEAQRNIKAKYIYNKVHNADSVIDMMRYLSAADKQRNFQEATAPENSKTANMVNLVIEQLKKVVQQPPSDYSAIDRDDESAMAATSDSERSVETRYQTRGRKKDKKERRHRHRSLTPSTSPIQSPPRYCSKYRTRRSGKSKPDKRYINPTNCPHCKEFGGYRLAHESRKNVPHTKCNYNKKWKGWRTEWVSKKIGIAYKEHGECN